MGLKPENWISQMAAEHGMNEPFVEHHTGKNEYSEVAIQLAQVRDVLSRF